jgi:hypothetical protein
MSASIAAACLPSVLLSQSARAFVLLSVLLRVWKPDNYLFATKARDSPLKMIDFGMSRKSKTREEGKYHKKPCGTGALCFVFVLLQRELSLGAFSNCAQRFTWRQKL